MPIAYLSIGSNLGDRVSNIQQAVSLLKADNNIEILDSSSFYETEPWGGVSKKWYVNAAIKIETIFSPIELLRILQNVEAVLGRCRDEEVHWGDRILDIDILFYDDLIFQNELLTLPHKHLHKRAYVLVPLLEIEPDFIHPVINKTIIELHEDLENPEDVFLYGTVIEKLQDELQNYDS